MKRAHPIAGSRRIAWLASYPKSGNTWIRLLLENFLAGSKTPVSINALGNVLPGHVSSNRQTFDTLSGVPSTECTDDDNDTLRPAVYRAQAATAMRRGKQLFCKAHDACHDTPAGEPLFPEDVTLGALYLLRNPLDVAVSFAFHQGHEDFSRIIAEMNDPGATMAGTNARQLRQRLFTWSRHVESWRDAPFPVLTVRYEDLLADVVGQLGRILCFLRLEGASDEPRLRRAAAFSDFAGLQQEEAREGFREAEPRCRRFFRSGKAGDWRRYLSTEQVREIASAHGHVMSCFGYDA